MPPTERAAYTPGAERAAAGILNVTDCLAYNPVQVAEIISRETGDIQLREQNAEMLEALKDWVNVMKFTSIDENTATGVLLRHTKAIIAKMEN